MRGGCAVRVVRSVTAGPGVGDWPFGSCGRGRVGVAIEGDAQEVFTMRAIAVVSLLVVCVAGGCGADGDAGGTPVVVESSSSEPAPAGEPTTTEADTGSDAAGDIHGTWNWPGHHAWTTVRTGTWSTAWVPEPADRDAHPYHIWGTYTFDDGVLTTFTADDSPFCAGDVAVWDARFSEDGDELHLTFVSDTCSAALAVRGHDQDLVRYTPWSSGCDNCDDAEPVIHDTWRNLHEADFGALLFTLHEDGTWRASARSADVRYVLFGTYTFDDGVLTLFTSDDSPYCPGEVGVWDARFSEYGDDLHLTLVSDTCTGVPVLRGQDHFLARHTP